MTVATKIPLTLEERLEYGSDFRIPASWEEFLDVLESCEYRVEYDNGEIISYMGYGTRLHEKLVGNIFWLLSNLLGRNLYEVYPSNLAIYMPGAAKKYINADVSVFKDQVDSATCNFVLQQPMTCQSEFQSWISLLHDKKGKWKFSLLPPFVHQSSREGECPIWNWNVQSGWRNAKQKHPVLVGGTVIRPPCRFATPLKIDQKPWLWMQPVSRSSSHFL